MATTNYHHSSHSSGFTEHEAQSLLREEEKKFQDEFLKAEISFRETDTEIISLEDELDAVLEDDEDQLGTITTYENAAHKLKIYGRANLKSLLNCVQFFWESSLGVLLLFIGGIGIPAIDSAMFHNLFSSDFENQFGEVSNTQAWLVALFSLQALGTFLAAKFFANTPERRAKLSIVVFVLGILFAVGASLEHANDKLLEHQAASNEVVISWDNSSGAQEATEISWGAIVSTYLLSLGFIALPLLGALLLSLGWDMFIKSRLGMKKAKNFRRQYTTWKQAIKKRNTAEAALIHLVENRETIIRGALDNKICAVLRGQRGQMGAARSFSRSRLSSFIGLPSPDDPNTHVKNVDGVEEHAKQQIVEFGGDYSERMIAKWKGQKPPT